MSKSCGGVNFQKLQDKQMNIIIDKGSTKDVKLNKLNEKIKNYENNQ